MTGYGEQRQEQHLGEAHGFGHGTPLLHHLGEGQQDDREQPGEAAEQGYPFHYAHDETQQTPKDFGATRTPEVFLLDGEGMVAYHGAIDDSHDPDAVAARHLAEAVDAVLSGGRPALATTQPVGCTIKWKP